MELQKLYYFVAAAQMRSFRKAAAMCMVAQPVLSRQIAALEAELGVRLFERSRSGVQLSPAGREFATYASNALDQVQQGRQMLIELDSGARGDVHVGCIEPLLEPFLLRAFAPFHARYPGVRLHLSVRGADDLIEFVEQRTLDFGLFGLPLDRIQRNDSLLLHELFQDRVHVILPEQHPLVAERSAPLLIEQLLKEPCVMLREGYSVRRVIEQAFARLGHEFTPVVETDTVAGLMLCVRQGIGITFLPPQLFRDTLELHGLQAYPVQDLLSAFAFGIVYRRFEQGSPTATALIKAVLQARIWER